MNPTLSAPTLESAIARGTHAPLPHVNGSAHSAAPAQASTTGLAGKSAAEVNDVRQAQLTSEQKTAGKLRSVKSTFMMPAQWEFFGMLGGGALGWGAKKLNWQRAQAAVGIASRSPIQALRQTDLAHALQVPAKFFDKASGEALEVGGKAADWAGGMSERSETLMASASKTEAKITGTVAPHLERFGAQLDRLQETSFGKKLQGTLDGFMKKRSGAALDKHTVAIAKAHEAVHAESVSFRQSITNRFTGGKAGKVDAGALQSVLDHIDVSKELTGGKAKADHLRGVLSEFETQMRGDAFKGEVKARAGNVMKHLQKAFSHAAALETYEHAAGDLSKSASLRTMAGAMGKALGRVPVYNALLTVGIAAGMGAVLVTARGEGKESKAAFKKLSAELKNQPDSHFLTSVKAAQKKGKHWSGVKTGMRLVGEGAEGGMWMMHNGGGMGMMGAMMLPQLVETMVPGNTMLGALEVLDKSDQGKVQLKPAERIELMTQLVGGIESVAKNGGIYNRLAKAVAAEMQERGYKYHDVVQLLGNDEAFGKFASEVSGKQKAEAAQRAEQIKAADAVVAAAPPAAAEAHAAMLYAAPTTRIGVGREGCPAQGSGSG